ncbi:CNBP [Mytilus edulis]|uniref:CNBP n=1 Tax=Mytilus edulis TaxID=6550 RepID=A0A8S3ST28_MYTED|nr:CNBP [Mytilus edulis]
MATAGKPQNDSDVSHNTNSSKTYNDAVKLGLIPKDYLNGEPHVNIHETLSSVKPVFILETDLFGEVKPSPDQFLTHLELYNSIDSCIPKSHLKGLQRVRGMWRIYPDSDNDRVTLITKKIIVRNKLINVYSTNPKSSEYSSLLYLRVRVKDVPCSADDGQILRAIENEGKCTVHKLNRERLRVDGLLTECQTGDRILFCDPLEKPLPRFIRIGKYRATVFHKDQMPSTNENLVCNKCFQNGHRFRDCQNDWVCKQCKLPGHKQADCPSFEAQNKESNSMPHENEPKSSSSSQSDTDSDESNTESIDDTPEENMHVAVSKSATKVNPKKLSNVLGKASKKITKETFSFENKTNDILEEVENPKKKKKKTTKRRKKSGDATAKKSNIQTTMFQFGAGTPDSRSEKRPATTPTDEVHERSVPIQKPKGH